MGFPAEPIKRVFALQSDADAAKELVAVMPTGLRAFDASTGALDWSYDLPVSAAAVLTSASGTPHVLIAYGTTLTRLDAATRTVVATYNLGAEINAVVGRQRGKAEQAAGCREHGGGDGLAHDKTPGKAGAPG